MSRIDMSRHPGLLASEGMERPDPTSATEPSSYVLDGKVAGKTVSFELTPGRYRVGSEAESDIQLRETSVSRRHAVLQVTPLGLLVEDRGSTNGTFVDGHRIGRSAVRPGAALRFGKVQLMVTSIHPDDAQLAIAFRPPSSVDEGAVSSFWPAPRTTVASRVASKGEATAQPSEQVMASIRSVLGAFAADAAEPLPANALGSALERLGSEIEARGGCIAYWPASGAPAIAASIGELGAMPTREDMESGPRATRGEAGGGLLADGRLIIFDRELDPSLGDGSRAALLFWGDAITPVAIPIVDALAPFFLRGSTVGPRPSTTVAQRGELRFPEGYRIATSPAMTAVYDQMRTLSAGDIPVMITGETGVGKERIARLLHDSSDRRHGPFVAVNCAALPADLLEAEMFGVARGAATGVQARPGRFREAQAGTLFLDEVGEMPAALQAKLLRALQEREIYPVGGTATSVDVRVLSATNIDLDRATEDGSFRRDLYFRLAGYLLGLPALRQCRRDIPSLTEYFVQRAARERGIFVRGLTVRALRCLLAYEWPGNIRELEHETRRLVYACSEGEAIAASLLSPRILEAGSQATEPPSDEEPAAGPEARLPVIDEREDLHMGGWVDALEIRLIAEALRRTEGHRQAAAALLGLSRNGLRKKMRRLGLDTPPEGNGG